MFQPKPQGVITFGSSWDEGTQIPDPVFDFPSVFPGDQGGTRASVMASVTWGSGSACYRVPCAHTGPVSDLICEVSHRDTGRTELGHHHTSEPALCLVQSYSGADTVRVR